MTMPSSPLARRAACLVLAVSLAAACGEPAPTQVSVEGRKSTTVAARSLVPCPVSEARTVTGVVGPLGGSVALGGTRITLPAGAVALPTVFTVTLPASPYMEVEITANGLEHLVFQLPVSITIDYGRCDAAATDRAPLSVWYVDASSKEFLEEMGGEADAATRTIRFRTGHLSSYAIAN